MSEINPGLLIGEYEADEQVDTKIGYSGFIERIEENHALRRATEFSLKTLGHIHGVIESMNGGEGAPAFEPMGNSRFYIRGYVKNYKGNRDRRFAGVFFLDKELDGVVSKAVMSRPIEIYELKLMKAYSRAFFRSHPDYLRLLEIPLAERIAEIDALLIKVWDRIEVGGLSKDELIRLVLIASVYQNVLLTSEGELLNKIAKAMFSIHKSVEVLGNGSYIVGVMEGDQIKYFRTNLSNGKVGKLYRWPPCSIEVLESLKARKGTKNN